MKQIARSHNATPEQVVFRFALAVGILPLTGTSRAEHMRADLDCFDLRLSSEEIEQIKQA